MVLWDKQAYFNADQPRPRDERNIRTSEHADGMHYWCRTFVETFVSAREQFRMGDKWDVEVKKSPHSTLPTSTIGSVCDKTFKKLFRCCRSATPFATTCARRARCR